jgi:ATP phosphoribosyltransferase
VRIGIACDGTPPPALLDVFAAAGLEGGRLAAARCPDLVPAGDDLFLVAPGRDVLACCRRGALDAAAVGKELLLEVEPGLPELLDLGIGRDRLVYAEAARAPRAGRPRPRVATRFPRLTRRHFDGRGRQIEALPLEAASSLALVLGAADGVVELEGRLAGIADDLVVRQEVASCSIRLVAARAARVLAGERLADLLERLHGLVEPS